MRRTVEIDLTSDQMDDIIVNHLKDMHETLVSNSKWITFEEDIKDNKKFRKALKTVLRYMGEQM